MEVRITRTAGPGTAKLAACAVGWVTHLNGSDEDTWRLVVRGAILARMEVEVATLTGNALADPPRHLDEEKVARYTQVLDQLPPVVVFQLSDGLLLVDGYHRVEAARRLGRRVIRAEVRQGSREDALRFAVDLAANERGLTKDQALDAIWRRSGKRWDLE